MKALSVGLVAASVSIAAISGKVTDISGTAIAGALVQLEKGGQTSTTAVDGSFTLTTAAVIPGTNNRSLPHHLSAALRGGVLCVNTAERSVIEIAVVDLSGRALVALRESMEPGTHSVVPRCEGAGVYLCTVRSGGNEAVLKGTSIGGVSRGAPATPRASSSGDAFGKQAAATAAMSDVIAATKTGYLDCRVVVTNSDTSGIVIAMIACAGTVTDADGNVYQSVEIGNQEWTVQNLRTRRYNDGSAIPLAIDNVAWTGLTTPGYCYFNNTANADSIRRFGALYNWYTVETRKLAPAGWHVPTDSEWTTLQNYLIANGYDYDGTTTDNKVAKAMAAKADWYPCVDTGTIGFDLTTNNRSGFSALPGGYRDDFSGGFVAMGTGGTWWTAVESDASNASTHYLYYDYVNLFWRNYSKSRGFSVRLVKG